MVFVNINQLRTFVTVVEHGSFSGAARALDLSQPAVTMQVQSLESDVGATLLDRRYRRVEVTEAGRILLPHARRILAEVEIARSDLASLAGNVSGRLVVAASTTPGQYVLPRLLGEFLRLYPEVGVTLQVFDTAEVVRVVESGDAHIGMTGAQVPGSKVSAEQLGADRLVLICSPDSPLLAGPVDLQTVAQQPFVGRETGSGTRMAGERALREAGIDPADLNVVMELGTGEAVVSAVAGGMGVAIVSEVVAEDALRLGRVALVPDAHFPVDRPLFVVTPRGTLTRAADALLGHLRAVL